MKSSTTWARKGARRSRAKCGMPIPWARALAPVIEREVGGGRAVHSAAHGHERASGARRQREGTVAGGRAERAVKRVHGQVRGVPPGGSEAAERLRDPLRVDSCG